MSSESTLRYSEAQARGYLLSPNRFRLPTEERQSRKKDKMTITKKCDFIDEAVIK